MSPMRPEGSTPPEHAVSAIELAIANPVAIPVERNEVCERRNPTRAVILTAYPEQCMCRADAGQLSVNLPYTRPMGRVPTCATPRLHRLGSKPPESCDFAVSITPIRFIS